MLDASGNNVYILFENIVCKCERECAFITPDASDNNVTSNFFFFLLGGHVVETSLFFSRLSALNGLKGLLSLPC